MSSSPRTVPPRRVGYHASHEQWAPGTLLEFVRLAESAGFGGGMCSDHFHPWGERQGQSGFAWSWLGAALQATTLSFGTVCAPGQRYFPPIIAQAAATLAEMFPHRFWVALGSGEYLNEHITGGGWPPKQERNARLLESVEVMRALWAGETVTHRGSFTVEDARLYSRPAQPPMIVGPALTLETAEWVGGWADALITTSRDRDEMRRMIDAFRAGGGEGKPVFLQVQLSYAPTREEARRAAELEWGTTVLPSQALADLRMPEDFDALAGFAAPDHVEQSIRISADVDEHADWIRQDLEMGFDRVYLHCVHRDQRRFIEDFGERVIPVVED